MAEVETASLPYQGVYVIAYLGRIIYIGKSNTCVFQRLKNHLGRAAEHSNEQLGKWLVRVTDWKNIRLDILEPPDDACDYNVWLNEVETKLIKTLNPLLNVFHGTMKRGATI